MKLTKKRSDSRGILTELFRGEFKQCNLLKMKKGSNWGGHYHKLTREFFYIVSGEVKVEFLDLSNTATAKKVTHIYKDSNTFIVEPNTIHNIHVNKNTICIVLYSEEFDELEPDIYK